MWRLTFDGTSNKVTVVDGYNMHTYTEVTSEDNVEFWKKQLEKALGEINEWHDKDTHWKAENMRLKRDYEAACAKVTELQRELDQIKKDYKTACDCAVERGEDYATLQRKLDEITEKYRSKREEALVNHTCYAMLRKTVDKQFAGLKKEIDRIKEIIEEANDDDFNA